MTNIETKIKCLICGLEFKGLTLHLKYKHNLSPKQYKEIFPNAEIFSSSVKEKMSKNNYLKNLPEDMRSLDVRYGDEISKSIKEKISINTTKCLSGVARSEDYKQKMKEKWEENYESWCLAIKNSSNTPERKEKSKIIMQNRIESEGYNLNSRKTNKLEKILEDVLIENNYVYKKQVKSSEKILGVFRYFDFYLLNQNLLIEIDGEYWHRNEDRIEIDKLKTIDAISNGYIFLRISDIDLKGSIKKKQQTILTYLNMSPEEMLTHSTNIISRREK